MNENPNPIRPEDLKNIPSHVMDKLLVVMSFQVIDPRNHQAKDGHKVSAPIALEFLRASGKSPEEILHLIHG